MAPGKALEEVRCCYPSPPTGRQPGRVGALLAKPQVCPFSAVLRPRAPCRSLHPNSGPGGHFLPAPAVLFALFPALWGHRPRLCIWRRGGGHLLSQPSPLSLALTPSQPCSLQPSRCHRMSPSSTGGLQQPLCTQRVWENGRFLGEGSSQAAVGRADGEGACGGDNSWGTGDPFRWRGSSHSPCLSCRNWCL